VNPAPSLPHDGLSALLAARARLPAAVFAVLDGALAPGLGDTLATLGLTSAPLYLEGGDPAVVASGPYLVGLEEPDDLQQLMTIPAAARAVFWSWHDGFAALRRHLRGINLIEVPAEVAGEPGDGAATVIFRHWDPNVLAPLLPLLASEQEARLFGRASGVAFDAEDHGGAAAVTSRRGGSASRGLLHITPAQVSALAAARVAASHRRIAAYLHEVAPAYTAAIGAPALAERIARHHAEADVLGLPAERDVARWSYLQLVAGGALFEQAAVREQFDPRLFGRSPRETLDAIFDELVRRLPGAG